MKLFDRFKLSYKKRFIILSVAFFVVFGLAVFFFTQNSDRNLEPFESNEIMLDTYVDQHIYSTEGARISNEVINALSDIQSRLSWRGENGDIWRLNNVQDDVVTVTEETAVLLSELKNISEKTGGAYDFTNLSTMRAWGFDTAIQLVPESDPLKAAVEKHGFEKITIDEETSSVAVNGKVACLYLEDIIKGAGVDSALEIYKESVTDGALIAIGECMGATEKFDGNGWNVQLRDPNGETTDVLGVLNFSSGCLATKGKYQKFFVEDNKVYHSILNPDDGMPANSGIASVTVLSNSGVLSEALAYAGVVSGLDKLSNYSEVFGAEIIAVTDDGGVYITKGLEKSFTLTVRNYTLNII